jgi:G3E family GTPase
MVPVVLLTGFLGSGKTTLLNRLMGARPPSPGKFAVVVNEFGDVGVDVDLLPPGSARQVELPGGCICCAMAEDLEATLLSLLDSEPAVEMIVVETTGIAEPLPISWTLAREPLSERVRLAAVVTVVDAVEHERHRPLAPSVDNQIEHADLLVLAKLDLAPGGEAPGALVDRLRALNPTAPILAAAPAEMAALLWRALEDPGLEGARSRDHGAARPAAAEHGFVAVSLSIDETLDFEELSARLEALPPEFVRVKGIARVVDESTGSAEPPFVAFHRVGSRVSAEPLASPAPGRIVAIGPGIEREPLFACVRAAVLP